MTGVSGEERQSPNVNSRLLPWPPSARHHHGFMRTGIMWVGDDQLRFPVRYADHLIADQGRGAIVRDLADQRIAEWMEFYEPRIDLTGHSCRPQWVCIFAFMGEVLALAEQEGVDTSIVTGTVALSGSGVTEVSGSNRRAD